MEANDHEMLASKAPPCFRSRDGNLRTATIFTRAGVIRKATAKRETTTNTGEASKTTINGASQSITLARPQDASHDSMLASRVESSSHEAIPWTAASQ